MVGETFALIFKYQILGREWKEQKRGTCSASKSESLPSILAMDHSDDPGASRLRQLATSKDPNILEEGVKLGRNFLGHLESCLQASASCDPSSQEWIKNIKKLQARTVSTSAIVGVFGNTGAGKSSLLNALLDEERYGSYLFLLLILPFLILFLLDS